MSGIAGSIIREHRSELAASQRVLAEQLGISHAMLSSVEKGDRPIPRARVLSFARAIKVRPGVLDVATALDDSEHVDLRSLSMRDLTLYIVLVARRYAVELTTEERTQLYTAARDNAPHRDVVWREGDV